MAVMVVIVVTMSYFDDDLRLRCNRCHAGKEEKCDKGEHNTSHPY